MLAEVTSASQLAAEAALVDVRIERSDVLAGGREYRVDHLYTFECMMVWWVALTSRSMMR